MACSSDSDEPFCQHVDTQCTPMTICKTCTRNLSGDGSTCNQVSQFPHARGKDLDDESGFSTGGSSLLLCLNFHCWNANETFVPFFQLMNTAFIS